MGMCKPTRLVLVYTRPMNQVPPKAFRRRQVKDSLGYTATRSFTVTILALAPFLDNVGA